jgi:hypothetical protein
MTIKNVDQQAELLQSHINAVFDIYVAIVEKA